ncbi:flagellar assembly protein FliX [Pleomorphomonas sp. JP5]|uniref:flagellar assembly protein FliX n=1 Tax=Pleomorphomonas sp. JP5 TaxID=2942998 RepID=UPI0020437D52|nr:flagellar assembly protein FliX [Pleomorphomonas sp. JP5]MCM5559487.1 flagellar assembly protein FliX [Pleomorphomonas sp. JP5]
MRIQGPNRLGGVSSGSPTKRTDGSGFALPSETEGGAPKTATATATHALAGLDALIALQAVDADAPRKKRKAVKRGRDLLDRLDEIRIGLLSGQLSGEAIARILNLLDETEATGDPRLDELMEDIALRAEVELAKLGYFRS